MAAVAMRAVKSQFLEWAKPQAILVRGLARRSQRSVRFVSGQPRSLGARRETLRDVDDVCSDDLELLLSFLEEDQGVPLRVGD